MPFPQERPRRMRRTEALRALVRETSLAPDDLVWPLFAVPGQKVRNPVKSMPGVFQLSVDELVAEAQSGWEAGVRSVILFGVPVHKDAVGSRAYDENGEVARAVGALKKALPGLVVATDVCLCEYTDEGKNMKKNIFNLVTSIFLLLIFQQNIFSQTLLIDPAGDGGFSNGSTFAANGWTDANSANNPWVIGTAIIGTPYSGNSAYVSTDGGTTFSYNNTSPCLNFFYRDITVPAGESKIILTFNWICNGESTWDLWQVFTAPTSVVPIGSTTYPGSGTSLVPSAIAGATFIGYGNLQTTAQTATLVLPPSLAGTTFRLILGWKSDTSGGTNPPAGIDNISLVSSLPTPLIGGNIYPINGTQNPPVSFASITTASAYQANDGVTGLRRLGFNLLGDGDRLRIRGARRIHQLEPPGCTRLSRPDFLLRLRVPGFHPGFGVLALFLLGLYVGRLQLLDHLRAQRGRLQRLLAAGLAIGLLSNLVYVVSENSAWAGIGYTFGGPSLAGVYICAIALLSLGETWQRRLAPLACVGRMALTNYVLQSVVCSTIFYGYGFGLYEKTGPSAGLLLSILIFSFQIPFSVWWLKRFQYGPLEWLWRGLTYGKRPPFLKEEVQKLQPQPS